MQHYCKYNATVLQIKNLRHTFASLLQINFIKTWHLKKKHGT
jgi:hypothetical protein